MLLLAVIGAALSWRHFRLSVLPPTEWKSTQPNPKPPPEPVKFEENYSEARSKPCDRSETAISTTICDVLRVPEVFAGKCIRVPGRFLSDGLEHSVIIDESCSKMGLSPWATEKVTRRLDAAIWQPGKGVPGPPRQEKSQRSSQAALCGDPKLRVTCAC